MTSRSLSWRAACAATVLIGCGSSGDGGSSIDAGRLDAAGDSASGDASDASTSDVATTDAGDSSASTSLDSSSSATDASEAGDAAPADAAADSTVDAAPPTDGGSNAADGASDAASDAPFVQTLADVGAEAAVDAACTANLDSDPANCGACGHGCLGAACVAGLCQPVLLATVPNPASVMIDDTRVYWGTGSFDSSSVSSVAKDGSHFQTIATGLHAPQGIFVDATNIFWIETGGPPSGAYKASKDGSNLVLLTQSSVGSECCRREIRADANWVYVLKSGSESHIEKVPRGGVPDAGAPTIISGGWTYAWGLAEDTNNLYWTSGGNEYGQMGIPDGGIPGEVVRMPKDGSTQPTVLATGGNPVFLTTDSTALYWTDRSGFVYRLPFGASSPAVLAQGLQPFGIAVDTTNVYFTTRGTEHVDGTLARVPKDGSAPAKVLVNNLNGPDQIALDDVAIYWGNTTGGTVMKLAK